MGNHANDRKHRDNTLFSMRFIKNVGGELVPEEDSLKLSKLK